MKTDHDQGEHNKKCDMLKQEHNAIAAVVLAGGHSVRMREDKALIPFQNMPLVEWVARRLTKQASITFINRGQHHSPLNINFPIIIDRENDLGPLGGIVTTFIYMKETHNPAQWLVSMPCDTPFFPDDLVQNLIETAHLKNSLAAIACYNGRPHYAIGLWSLTCQTYLETYLDNGGRSIQGFLDHLPPQAIAQFDFGGHLPLIEPNQLDPFFNINERDDVKIAQENLMKTL